MFVLIVLSEIISFVQLKGSIQDKRKTGKEQPQLPGSSVTYHCTCSHLNNQSNKITFIITLRPCWSSYNTMFSSSWSPRFYMIIPTNPSFSAFLNHKQGRESSTTTFPSYFYSILQRKTTRTPVHLELWHSNLNHNKHTLSRFFLPCNGTLQFFWLTSGSCLWFIQTWTAQPELHWKQSC